MMLGFVQNFFAPRANPIGVDFGSDCLRMAQCQFVGNEYRLVAAASADVPAHVRTDPSARLAFFVETTRDLLAQGNFRSRQAVLALPASVMCIQHLRMGKMTEEETRKALPWEARGKLPMDPTQALLRHITAGEIYEDQEPKHEVIVMAAARGFVNDLLAAAARARLDVVGMNVEPKALVDCFGHVHKRQTDLDATSCYLDIGATGTRVVIARGAQIYFARTIPIGGDHFAKATALALRTSVEEAKLLRFKLSHAAPAPAEIAAPNDAAPTEPAESSFVLLGAGLKAASHNEQQSQQLRAAVESSGKAVARAPKEDPMAQQARQVEQAIREPLNKLIEELDLCRRYHEATFPGRLVDRLVFVGGEARQRAMCQHIARQMQLAAQVGDPIARMGRISEIGPETGIDRRHPQPSWAVALGLSLGPVSEKHPQAPATK
jgi:type IV pilus assembly protein PilM